MKIEIINTGNELLLGTTLNTHGAWIGQELSKIGLRVCRQVTVPDGDAIAVELERALLVNDIVIVTGGLGPTSDDLTREETAKALDLELIEDEYAVRTLKAFFESRGRQVADCNLKQALAPCGSDVLPNNKGTAPGVYVPPRLGNSPCAVFLLPGPPFELKPMFMNEVVPRLESMLPENHTVGKVKILSFIGIGESDFHELLDGPLQEIEGLEFGYCARPSDLDLRLIGSDSVLARATELVLEQLAHLCYTTSGESIEQALVRKLTQRKLTLTTAESCTGGGIASRITDVSGSSAVFNQSIVSYADESKISLLGVDECVIQKHGAVSEQVVREMSEGAIELADADIAIAVSGIAGPTGGSKEKPVGTVWISIAQRNKETLSYKEVHPRGREVFKQIVSRRVLGKVFQLIAKE